MNANDTQTRGTGMNQNRCWQAVRHVLPAACLVVVAAGCAGTPEAGDRRLARYYPDVEGREPWRWERKAVAPTGVVETAETEPAGAGGEVEAAESDPFVDDAGDDPGDGATQAEDGSPEPGNSPASGRDLASLKPLDSGDRISIYLTGIPTPEQIRDIIDGNGNVNLPLIGEVNMAGKTAAEAEQYIESRYVDDGYYRKITVSVVPQEGEFYVRGEVKREGKYVMTGTVTLLQTIAEAGGYTDYANSRRVKVKRGEDVFEYDVRKIEELEAEDPVIESGDIIIVPRRFY